ncbi:MAG: DHH family phosphoesterase [Candidatus Aenigmarchaeota archaeon]|nr:DHH family phosphoesterase [Candidatus Aenigmarchaeota archaeon]
MERLLPRAGQAAQLLKEARFVRVVSHYDCDGICSAAIMATALQRAGIPFHLTFVNQLTPQKLQRLAADGSDVFLFLDIGSGYLAGILAALPGRQIVVADHHQPDVREEERLCHFNPLVLGVEEEISGSGLSYVLANALSAGNTDLSWVAVVGAIGDAQMGSIGNDISLSSLNASILQAALDNGSLVKKKGIRLFGRYSRPIHKAIEYCVDPHIPGVSGSESASVQFLQDIGIELKKADGWRTLADLSEAEQQKLATHMILERIAAKTENPSWIFGDIFEITGQSEYKDANEFATIMNACGKLGVPHLGLALCTSDADSAARIKPLMDAYRREIGKGISFFEKDKTAMRETMAAYYVFAGAAISEHVIANVASIANRSLYTAKPLFAFADAEDGLVKISARLHEAGKNNGINLKELVSEAARPLGGDGGGHKAAAGAFIPKGKEELFMQAIESKLKNLPHLNEQHSTVEHGRDPEKRGEVEGKGLVRYLSA